MQGSSSPHHSEASILKQSLAHFTCRQEKITDFLPCTCGMYVRFLQHVHIGWKKWKPLKNLICQFKMLCHLWRKGHTAGHQNHRTSYLPRIRIRILTKMKGWAETYRQFACLGRVRNTTNSTCHCHIRSSHGSIKVNDQAIISCSHDEINKNEGWQIVRLEKGWRWGEITSGGFPTQNSLYGTLSALGDNHIWICMHENEAQMDQCPNLLES